MWKKVISTALVVAMVLGMLPGMSVVYAAGDTDAPVLEDLYATQEGFGTDEQVEIIAKFYEPSGINIAESGMLAGKMGVTCPYSYNIQEWDVSDCTSEVYTEEEAAQGYCAVRFALPVDTYFSTGTYYIGQVVVQDNAQNQEFYNTYLNGELRIQDKFFEIVNDNTVDDTTPQLESVTVDKTEVNVGDSITCSIVATDESGINPNSPGFVNITCEQNGQWNTYYLSASSEENIYTYTLDVTEDMIPGNYYISDVGVQDNTGLTYYAGKDVNKSEFTQEDFWSYGRMPENSQLEFAVTNDDYTEKEAPRVTNVQFLQDNQPVDEVYAGDLLEFVLTVDDGGTAIQDSMYLRLNKMSQQGSSEQIDGVNLRWDEATKTYRGKHYISSGWSQQEIHMGYMIYHQDGYTTQYSDWEDQEYIAPVLTVKSVFNGMEDLTVVKGSSLDLKAGIEALNITDGNMTDQIQVRGTVNLERTGIYRIHYEIPCKEITGEEVTRESGTYLASRWVCVTDAIPEDESLSLISKDDLYVGNFSDVTIYKDGAVYNAEASNLTEDGIYEIEIAEDGENLEENATDARNRIMLANTGNGDVKHFSVAVDKTAPEITLTETNGYVSASCKDMMAVKVLKYMEGSQKAETVAKKGIDIKDGFQGVAGKTYTVYAEDLLGNGSAKEITLEKAAPTEYSVTYHLNGGKNSKDNPASYLSGQKSVNLKGATREGYWFDGWYLDSKFSSKITAIKGTEEKNLNLYAKWKKVTITQADITSLKNSGSTQLNVAYKTVNGAKGYEIVYANNSKFTSGKKTINTDKTKGYIKNLSTGTTYYVKVRAYKLDSAGKKVYGSYSTAKSYKTAPTTVQIKKVSGSSQKITVTWNQVKGASKYQVYMATSKNGTYQRIAETGAGTSSYSKSGLSNAKNYYFKVRAYNTVGSTKLYGSFGTVKGGTTSPTKAAISSVTGGTKKAVIKWGKVSGASGYEVYMSSSSKGTYKRVAKVSSSTTSYTKTGLSDNKSYYFKVRAYRTAEGTTAYGSYSNYKYSGTATATPAISKISGGAKKITVSWKNVTGEKKYELYMSTTKTGTYKRIASLDANKTSYTKTGLSTAKGYYFKVRTYRTVNGKNVYSSFSPIKYGVTSPSAPTMKSVSGGAKKAYVKWNKVSGADGYEVYMSTSKNGSYSRVAKVGSSATSYTKTSLSNAKTYYFKVRALKKGEGSAVTYSPFSTVKSCKTKKLEKVWVVDKPAWTEEIPNMVTQTIYYCSCCGMPLDGVDQASHFADHEAEGDSAGVEERTITVEMGFEIKDHPEKGHWEYR